MGPKIRVPLLHSALCQRAWQMWQSSSYIVTYCCVIASVVVCSVVVVLQVYALFTAGHHGVDVGTADGAAHARSDGMGYAIVVDAGSSGSRGYLYMWPPHSGNRQDLLSIQPLKDVEGQAVMHAISPGLSSLRGKPEQAAVYLEPILDFASIHIPAEKHRETPLYVMATAGMRLLDTSEQEAIISSLRTGIQAKYSFIVATNNIQVITGREEGIYQWIAVNFALGRFRHSWDGPLVTVDSVGDESVRRLQTVGAVDMGGASMQIAFEVVDKTQEEALGDQRSALAVINLGCADHDHEHTYKLYVRTFLGYGANEMYRRHQHAVRASVTNTTRRLYDPCLVRDYVDAALNRTDAVCGHPTLLPSICTVPITGTGDWHMCETALIKQIRDERVNRQCSTEAEANGSAAGRQLHPYIPAPCTRTLDQLPAGVGSPETFGFSEFWYSMEDTLRVGGKYHYSSFKQTASDYCETAWSTVTRRLQQGLYGAGADSERLSRQCFKSAYVTAALHEGLGVTRDYAGFTSSPSQVAGRVASWTVGALLYKLRFLPVRSVEQVQFSHFHAVTTGVWGSQYWLLVCVLVVAAVLLLYARRIRRMRSRRYSTETADQTAPLLFVTVHG